MTNLPFLPTAIPPVLNGLARMTVGPAAMFRLFLPSCKTHGRAGDLDNGLGNGLGNVPDDALARQAARLTCAASAMKA